MTRAILPVHLGGHIADMPALLEVARRHGLHVLEDCAQAIDATLSPHKAGTWGDLGTFSFQSNKTMTSGEGGLILTNRPDLAERITRAACLRPVQQWRRHPIIGAGVPSGIE